MPSWQEATIHANGIDIHYWRTGTGKPTVLCSHGLTDNGHCWSLFAQQLAGEYDLIMPDARGHGLSSAPETGYRTEDRAADSLALLDALQLDRVYAVGHSMGGDSTGMLTALAPERIIAAVLEDPSFRPGDNRGSAEFATNWANSLRDEQKMSFEQLVEYCRTNMPDWDERVRETWAESKQQANPLVFTWIREPRTPWEEYVAKIRVPTLVITGEPERGAIITPEIADMLKSLSPQISVLRIADAGHCVRYAQPEQFARAVRSFLADHPAS